MRTRLLIVDDHEIVRLGERMLFSKDDSYQVCGEARNGDDAIRMVSELAPDAVILGLNMSGMNGFETATRIHLIAPSTRIIIFSAHEIPASARLAGADAFVSKSCPLEELSLTVSRVLHLRKWEEHHATRAPRDTLRSRIGAMLTSARVSGSECTISNEFTERRHETRTNFSRVVRIRPFDSCLFPEDCKTLNVSNGGLYFATPNSYYAPGLYVYVMSDLESNSPMDNALAGVVVWVEKLEDDKWGVAIRTFASTSSMLH